MPEEERRAADMAAAHNPEIAAIARRCIVDYDVERADALEVLGLCTALLKIKKSSHVPG